MNAGIAELLRDRISAFAYVDKIAGLVRPVSFQRAGELTNYEIAGRQLTAQAQSKVVTVPIAIDVDDPLSCDEAAILDLVPDERYRTIVYFEDRGVTIGERQGRGTRVSHIRLVCWINTTKLNGNNFAGDTIMQDFEGALNGAPYNSDAFLGIRHRVESFPAKGPGLFGQYTYPEGVRQYLMWPFDAFAIDIATEYMPNPACLVPVDVEDVACWTPPATKRRRNPNEFTCEELTDPDTGLTDEQLGPDCLNCEGGGPCDGATVNINGVEVATPASGATANLGVVDQDGNQIGSFVAGQWVVTIPEEVDNILPYADRAAALADVGTVPDTNQYVVINDTGRMYHGNGTSTVAELVADPQVVIIPAREDGALYVTVEGVEYKLQLNG